MTFSHKRKERESQNAFHNICMSWIIQNENCPSCNVALVLVWVCVCCSLVCRFILFAKTMVLVLTWPFVFASHRHRHHHRCLHLELDIVQVSWKKRIEYNFCLLAVLLQLNCLFGQRIIATISPSVHNIILFDFPYKTYEATSHNIRITSCSLHCLCGVSRVHTHLACARTNKTPYQ